MTWRDDHELRWRFQELREEDRSRAPSFDAMSDRVEAGVRPNRMRPALWVAAAAGVLLAVGIGLSRPGERPPLARGADPTPNSADTSLSIIDWTSPTAGLLRTPGSDVLLPPPILSSILDRPTHTPGQRKGD